MLIPIGHDSMSARRWPVVTFGLILANLIVFLGTHWAMEKQDSQLEEVREHILILSAMHPQLILMPQVAHWVDDFKKYEPSDWEQMQSPKYQVLDEWDARTRQLDDPVALQAEMDSLADKYSQLLATSIGERYGFNAAHPTPIAYLTATFLHADWSHLIWNMWFLWVAGFVLEDAWGRPIYLLVYLLAGVMSHQFYAWVDHRYIDYSLGSSGAVAGLMGAFLVRFPKKEIRMTWFFFPFHRFWVPAYLMLPEPGFYRSVESAPSNLLADQQGPSVSGGDRQALRTASQSS
jgi:membrane associated rhomboid family serine protease